MSVAKTIELSGQSLNSYAGTAVQLQHTALTMLAMALGGACWVLALTSSLWAEWRRPLAADFVQNLVVIGGES